MAVTMEYIARMANVSKATVSRVVNGKKDGVSDEVRQRVQRLIEEYEYTPNLMARSMVTARTKTIGVVIPDIENPFFSQLVGFVEQHLRNWGYTAMLCNTYPSSSLEVQGIRTMLAKQVDGIILVSAQSQSKGREQGIGKYGVPCVLLDRKNPSIDYNVGIFVDNEGAFRRAAEMLLRHQNRRIAFIRGPAHFNTSQERFRGYVNALKKHGVTVDEDLIVSGNFGYQSGYDAVMTLLERKAEFTALMASNDMMAFGAMRALQERGFSIPEQVEVMGCDDIFFCNMIHPTLSTVAQPIDEMGRLAAEVMMDLIAGNHTEKKDIWLEAHMVERDSTRKA